MTKLSFQFIPQPNREGSDFPPEVPTLSEGEYTESVGGVQILDCEKGQIHVTDSGSIRYRTEADSISESTLNETYKEAIQVVCDLLETPSIEYSVSLIVNDDDATELSVNSEEMIEHFGKKELDVDEFGYTDLHSKAIKISFRTGQRARLA